jgi:hypothetical protein
MKNTNADVGQNKDQDMHSGALINLPIKNI